MNSFSSLTLTVVRLGPFRSCKTIYIVLASACYQPADRAEVLGDIQLLHELGMLPP